ncbi:DMP19 family protein [Zooshikella ganghwensis]|uniref:DMP19 family protein n=1 Tax=Zooshikella ganghwensis TaxID=202772 RepID=UPI0003FC4F1B|nr:DUF4375 domain-containing protein [Zooshikella ganghwensis]
MKIEDRVQDRIDSVGFENLSDPEKTYWLIWLLEAYANNGGLEKFFECDDNEPELTYQALLTLKATEMAKTFLKAKNIYEKDESSIFSEEMRALSNHFTDYPDPLGQLVDSYVQENAAEFYGPKNDVEMWASKKAKGQNTPRFVTKEIDYKAEAIEDEKYSSRVCPECSQPVPDYRKSCKKCGFPVGRLKA